VLDTVVAFVVVALTEGPSQLCSCFSTSDRGGPSSRLERSGLARTVAAAACLACGSCPSC